MIFSFLKEILSDETLTSPLTIPAKSSKTREVKIRPDAKGMDYPNPVVAGFLWGRQ